MDKKTMVMGLLLGIVLLSGCIQAELKEVIHEDGMSDVTVKMDVSALTSMPGADPTQNPCDDVDAENSPLTDIQCTYENGIATVTGRLNRAGMPGFTMEGGKYRLDIKNGFEVFSSAAPGTQSMPMPTQANEQQIQQMKAMGFALDYYVKMPGSVTNQSGGELQDDGSVKFDLLEMPDDAFVESSTATFFGLDQNMAIIIALVVGVVIIIVAIVLLKR